MTSTTLWMGDVEPYWDENFIRSAFTSNGETPTAVKMMKNRASGGQARYCFVDFANPAAAERVIMNLNGKPVPNSSPPRLFKLNFAVYGMQAPPKAPGAGGGIGERGGAGGPGGYMGKKEFSLFIGELTPEVEDYALYNFFSRRYPSIKGAKVILDGTGISRGFGFVRFSSEEEHQTALSDMQGATGLGGRALRVSVATPKKPRPQGPGGEGMDTWSSGVGSWPSGGGGGGGGGGNTWNAEGGSTWNSGGGGGGGSSGGGSWNSGGGSQWNSGNQWDGSSQGWGGSQGGTWESGGSTWGGAGQQNSWGGSSAAATGSGGAQQSSWGGGGGSQQAGWGANQDSWGSNSQGSWGGGQQQQYGQYQGYQQQGQY
ncbi:uncharacterized protein LOC144445519 isoform X2 [Glandiceps talaboti]